VRKTVKAQPGMQGSIAAGHRSQSDWQETALKGFFADTYDRVLPHLGRAAEGRVDSTSGYYPGSLEYRRLAPLGLYRRLDDSVPAISYDCGILAVRETKPPHTGDVHGSESPSQTVSA